jgi:hypothetical protein
MAEEKKAGVDGPSRVKGPSALGTSLFVLLLSRLASMMGSFADASFCVYSMVLRGRTSSAAFHTSSCPAYSRLSLLWPGRCLPNWLKRWAFHPNRELRIRRAITATERVRFFRELPIDEADRLGFHSLNTM